MLVDTAGDVGHWRPSSTDSDDIGWASLLDRGTSPKDTNREQRVTYNVYVRSPRGSIRPWSRPPSHSSYRRANPRSLKTEDTG